ncbi:MAG: HAD hydrolase family protein [Chlorobi bacterium]|nr:HAD hydrolase family protein [Chlorobiota bacterium]
MMDSDKLVIAVDFDGTIVEHKYPKIGAEIPHALDTLKMLKEQGHTLILWTFRSGKELEKAIKFCKKRGFEFHAVNNNSPGETYDHTYSRKIYADLYIDDRNILGIPDWATIYEIVNSKVKP